MSRYRLLALFVEDLLLLFYFPRHGVLHHVECYSFQAVSNFDLFTLDDVDTAFANSIQLKYQQHYQLAGPKIVYIVLFLWI